MSLKSIRESYSKLLTVFKDAGVSFNESQKADLDTFVLALESNMESQRKQAIRMTRKAVESKMEKEYRQVFESIMKNMQENARLASKVQEKCAAISQSRRISRKVDEYLDMYVEKVLPKKTVVDYDRMRRLEKLHESLKDALVVDEDAVGEKIDALEKAYKVRRSKCETEVAKARAKLDESMATARRLKSQLERYKAMALLESKTKDLPTYEARRVKNRLAGVTADEVERRFDRTLRIVREEAKKAKDQYNEDTKNTVEGEINEILGGDDAANEDEYRRPEDMPHNLHTASGKRGESGLGEDEEQFETVEEVKMNDQGEVELDESDVIDGNLMKLWCRQAVEVN